MKLLEHEINRYYFKGLLKTSIGIILFISFGFIGKLLEPLYLKLYHSFSEKTTYIFLILLIHHLTYLFCGLYNLSLTTLQHPFFEKYKINSQEWIWKTNPSILKKTLFNLLLSSCLFLPVFLFILKSLNLSSIRYDLNLPTMWDNIKFIPFCVLCETIWFYTSHRVMHEGFFYEKFHKIHHEYTATIGIAASYCHPVEYVFVNLIASALGPALLGSRMHLITYVVWVCYRVAEAIEAHSGYDFPWSPFSLIPLSSTPSFHDFHHEKNEGNYGSGLLVMDLIFGTCGAYFRCYEKLHPHLLAEYKSK